MVIVDKSCQREDGDSGTDVECQMTWVVRPVAELHQLEPSMDVPAENKLTFITTIQAIARGYEHCRGKQTFAGIRVNVSHW